MPYENESEQPQITFDESDDAYRNRRLSWLRDAIEQSPHTLAAALAIINPRDVTKTRQPIPPKLDGEIDGLLEIFDHGDDKDLEYDEETDETLDANPDIRELRSALKRSHSRTVKQGSRSVTKENPEATVLRDQIRHQTLSHYIGRVIDWQEEQKTDGEHIRPAS